MGTEAENIHRRAAGRLAEDRNIVRIAVEALDIRAYPFQGKGLIPETLVTTADVVSRRPEAQIPHPVLDSHHYHVFLTLKLRYSDYGQRDFPLSPLSPKRTYQ